MGSGIEETVDCVTIDELECVDDKVEWVNDEVNSDTESLTSTSDSEGKDKEEGFDCGT